MGTFITPISNQDVRTTSSTQNGTNLGAYAGTPDGKIYRYGLAGAVNLSPGKIVVTPAVVANHQNRTTTAAAIGAFSVSLNIGATAMTLDQYKDGYLTVNDATGEGISYLVEGNAASSGSAAVEVALAEPVKVALVASTSEATLHVNPFASVIISPSAVAHHAVGVPNVSITAANYGWFQVNGYCSVLADGVIGKGSGAILSDAVDGAVEVEVAGTVTQRVGTAVEATVDTEYRTIDLKMF